ncbi:hypothetical protein C0Q70_02951 [Pomacea canaliculata]|uniref:EGF-like domain-containing protein n=1 Tax=Pomacea canaliculata TaxID=400727 RepID=A0A2T7PRC8_POMCA|nr:hypothetical protein C0Q70_02951 [Pomacea canaliculata]
MTLRRRAEQEGYSLVINDISGRQRIAVYIGRQLRLEYLDVPSKPVASLTFDVTVEPETWYHVAIKVQGRQAVLYFDCNIRHREEDEKGKQLPGNQPHAGDIEQLSISEDPQQAERQCHFQTGDHFELIKDDNGNNNGGGVITTTTVNPQKDTKTARPVAVTCRVPCQNGGTCNESGMCACPLGYTGDSCQSGMLLLQQHCAVLDVKMGEFVLILDTATVCSPPCVNSGQCIGNNQCACPYGSVGQDCQRKTDMTIFDYSFLPTRMPQRRVCVRYDKCRCPKGYTGQSCTQAVCRHGCANGGKCVSPNRCSCPANFRGKNCNKHTPAMTSPDTCNITCLNGGRCRKDTCRCPKHVFGRRCERRSCKYEPHNVPYKKTYKRIVKEEVMTRCGPWNWRTCVRTRLKYITITTDAVRTVYRCV